MALLYFTVLFRETQSFAAVIGAGVASIAASLARYEGWFVIPFVAIYFLIAARKHRIVDAAALLRHRGARPALLARPQLVDLFQSAGILQRALFAHEHLPPGAGAKHGALSGRSRLASRALYYLTAVRLCAGWAAVAIAIAGLAGALWKRMFWPVFFAALPPLFYVWSMHSGGTPIFVPTLWPFSYYNTRYALAALAAARDRGWMPGAARAAALARRGSQPRS